MPRGAPWSDDEVRRVVAAAFDLLANDGRDKAEARRNLAPQLDGRSDDSISLKLENVSYAMKVIGLPAVPGLSGRPNIQKSLLPAVEREGRARGLIVDDDDLRQIADALEHAVVRKTDVIAHLAARYQSGESIRAIAENVGRSFGFVYNALKEAGVSLRGDARSIPANGGMVKDAEVFSAADTTYELPARAVVVSRVEADLVRVYRESLPANAVVSTIRSSNLAADLYIQTDGSNELVEAKAVGAHLFVRQALGQLLDYANSFDVPITTLAALFPFTPTREDIALLNQYGIDCVFANGDNSKFVRRSAPSSRRQCWQRPSHKIVAE